MKVNIIRTEANWVIGQISDCYAQHLHSCTLHQPGYRGNPEDINIYITYAAYRGKTHGLDIGWFTHREKNDPHLFDSVAQQVDVCIAMSQRTAALLPTHKTVVIEPGIPESFIQREIVFGCVGRDYSHTDRKKFSWLDRLRHIPRARFDFTNQQIAAIDMPRFYRSIDYLLILSENEGGPMPVPECIASGTPVIAPDVGWCWEYPVIRYSSLEDLCEIICKLTTPRYTERQSAERLSKLLEYLQNEKGKYFCRR